MPLTVGLLEICRHSGVPLPNPQLFTALAVTFAAYQGGYRTGLAGAAVGIAYAAYFFALPGGFLEYDAVGAEKIAVNLITLPGIAILVSRLNAALVQTIHTQAQRTVQSANKALTDTEHQFRDFAAAANALLWECDRDCRFTWRHPAQRTRIMLPDEQFYGRTYWEAYGEPEVNPTMGELKRHMLAGEAFRDCEIEIPPLDGERRFRRISGNPVYDADGNFAGFRGTSADISDEVNFRNLSVRLSARFESFIDNSPFAIFLKDLEGRYQAVNRCFAEWHGVTPEDLIGKTAKFIFDEPTAETFQSLDREVIASRQPIEREREIRFRDGTIHNVIVTKFPVFDDAGQVAGVGSVNVDITEHMRAEMKLRESESFLRSMADNTPALISYFDRDRNVRFANKTFADRYGFSVEEMVGMNQQTFWPESHRRTMADAVARTLAGEATVSEGAREYPDGSLHYHVTSRAPHFDAEGNVVGYFVVTQDRTDQKKAEDQLRQAQKMEAVGQLTGGIAHDFNNLLMVILGNAEVLEGTLTRAAPGLGEIVHAAERGAELTQRLLAFSRQQSLNPQPVEMDVLVSGLKGLLARTLGETIKVSTEVQPGPGVALADRGQLENAILNLAINARDAMPTGGRLTISCAQARLDLPAGDGRDEALAGNFISVAVRDTGSGMAAEVLEHAYEPFYTTKPVGEGSGLGLSMVYGFAMQSHGHVEIKSKEGHGTTVTLYLPLAEEVTPEERARPALETPAGGSETVLIIEDEEKVRAVAVKMLERLGYRAIAVPDAPAAYAALAAERIDLVLSDVVLAGGVSGPEIAQKARTLYPDLKIIFMSGYPATSSIQGSNWDAADVLLTKPFRQKQLAEAVRKALD